MNVVLREHLQLSTWSGAALPGARSVLLKRVKQGQKIDRCALRNKNELAVGRGGKRCKTGTKDTAVVFL